MNRRYALATLVVLVACAVAVHGQHLPSFAVLGAEGSSTFTLLPTGQPSGSTSYHYFRVDIPHNAYLVTINSTLSGCNIASQPANISVITYSSVFLPCDHEYRSNISEHTNASTICQGGWDSTTANDEGLLGLDGRFTQTGLFVALENAPPDLDTETIMMQAADIPVTPNGHLWIAVGKYQTDDYEAQCEVILDVATTTCPGDDQLAFSGDEDRPTYCVPYSNVTITSVDTVVSPTASETAIYDGFVWRIPSVPSETNFLVIHVSSSSDILLGGAGPHLIGAQGSTCVKDCELSSATYTGEAIFPYSYNMTCFAPRWNQPYYIAVSNLEANGSTAATFSLSVEAHGCPNGMTGVACKDPLLPLPDSQPTSVVSLHAPAGLVHWAFDVPANTWNNTFLHVQLHEEDGAQANNATWGSLYVRQGTFSHRDRNANGYTSPRFTTYARNGFLLTPYERFNPVDTKWVITFECANAAEGLGCDFSLRFSFVNNLSQLPEGPITTPSSDSPSSLVAPAPDSSSPSSSPTSGAVPPATTGGPTPVAASSTLSLSVAIMFGTFAFVSLLL